MAGREILHSFDFNTEYPNVVFSDDVETTDYYRSGNPYKLFYIPGESKVDITFELIPEKVGANKQLVLQLNHCNTNAYGTVDILINGNAYR